MSYDILGALLVAPIMMLLTYPLAKHAARTDDDPMLLRIIMWALVLKFFSALVRYWVAFELYGGSADASVYLNVGQEYADNLRQGDFVYDRTARGGSNSTHFIRQVTGWVLFFIGPSRFGAFFVFSWFSFLGLFLFHRAFSLGVPNGNKRRYAYLVFLLPSLLYWPSSVGKEAWMLLVLGLGAYGAARVLTQSRGGFLVLAVGIFGSSLVRPHMTVLLAGGLAVAYLLRRAKNPSAMSAIGKVIGGSLALGVVLFAIQAAEERFGVEGEGIGGAEQVIDDTVEQTSQGGSEFEASRPDSILDIPVAAFTVMFRPLPFEAHNAQAFLSSLEGVFLMGLFVLSRRRVRRSVYEAFRTPYVAFAAVYTLGFTLAFASFGNFGILVRQRAQLFPVVLVLLAIPASRVITDRLGSSKSRESVPILIVLPAGSDEHESSADLQGDGGRR